MAQFFMLTGLWTVYKRILETLSHQLTSVLRLALIHPTYMFIHSLQWTVILKHTSLTLFIFWHISHLNARKREIYIAMWTLYSLFNALTIFWECNIQDSPRSRDGLLIVFRGFNIGMLIMHALIMHVCHKFKTWYAEMGLLADSFASADRRITSHDVFYTLWPFLLPRTRKTRVFVSASFALKILSSYLNTLSMSIGHQKYLDAVPYTNVILYGHIINLLDKTLAKLHIELLNRANSHDCNALKSQIFSHIMHLSADFHSKKQWPVISAALDDGNLLILYSRNTAVETIVRILDLILGVYHLLKAFGINGACIVFTTTLVYFKLEQTFDPRARVENVDEVTRITKRAREDGINGWQDVALFNLMTHTERHFKQLLERSSELSLQSTRHSQIKSSVQEFFMTIMLALNELYLVYRIQHQEASKADLVMFATYWRNIRYSVTFFSTVSHKVREKLITAKHVVTILRTKPTVEDRPGAVPLKTCKGTIEFKNVSFGYNEGEPVLRDISFFIDVNEAVAVVGPSGSGKSTIALLLMRFYNPDKGSILVDGQDIQSFTIQSVRNHFSAVLQSIFVHNGSILDNVRYGNMNATDEQVINACQTAGLDKDVQGFTQGYKTIIGEQGQNLSGGQTQRIAIARAILRGPKMSVLILDEATSALDNITTWGIMRYLHNLKATRLIVTHNLNIAAVIPRIIVINDGRIIADGSHTELLMSSDSYSALWNSHLGEHFPDGPGRQEAPDCDRTI